MKRTQLRRAKRLIVAALGLAILLAGSALVSAKGATSKVTITGGSLSRPIEITDLKILEDFNVWSGPGTSMNGVEGSEGFIIDWRTGSVATRPRNLHRYHLSFYVADRNGGPQALVYVVEYERGPTGQGYVYLPGRAEEWGVLNTRAIYRSREGNWFRATKAWDDVMRSVLPHTR